MIKLKFQEEEVQQFNNKCVVVTLKAAVEDFPFTMMPKSIMKWVSKHPLVKDSYFVIALRAQGKALCSDSDEFDPKVGRIIAESRAKIKIYRFMLTLLLKIFKYYERLTWGRIYAPLTPERGSIGWEVSKYGIKLKKEKEHLERILP